MENTTLNLPKLEEITQVYRHRKNKADGCRCGCLGRYWAKDGTKANDRKIKRIYDIIMSRIPEATVTDEYIDIWTGDRFLTMYFRRNVSQPLQTA